MAHSDDNGLILPPKLAPNQVVIIPVYQGNQELDTLSETANRIKEELINQGVTVKYDDRDTQKPGWKFAEYELKGVPVRIVLGPRDIENKTAEIARRDTMTKETISQDAVASHVKKLLDEIQASIYNKALKFRDENLHRIDDYDQFKEIIRKRGGFVMAHWDGTEETENLIKQETKATVRCIPLDEDNEPGKCIRSGKASKRRVLFAKAY